MVRVATEGLDCGPLVDSERVAEMESSLIRLRIPKTADICICLKAWKKVSGERELPKGAGECGEGRKLDLHRSPSSRPG